MPSTFAIPLHDRLITIVLCDLQTNVVVSGSQLGLCGSTRWEILFFALVGVGGGILGGVWDVV
eukprot:2199355-Rhodomonas_salina.1